MILAKGMINLYEDGLGNGSIDDSIRILRNAVWFLTLYDTKYFNVERRNVIKDCRDMLKYLE